MIKDPKQLMMKGKVLLDDQTLNRFSSDASSYKIKPRMVVEPVDESDVVEILSFAHKNKLSVTCRGGGSGLSGAGVGNGIIVHFKENMNTILRMSKEAVVQPGVVLDDFLDEAKKEHLMLPSVPTSSGWCCLGGNVSTRSTGPRTARYGTIDSFVSSLRFITSEGQVVDTREELPEALKNGLLKIQKRYLDDSKARDLFENRPFIAGGYNIKAFSQFRDPRQLATHLLVGSVGTLAVITRIRLNLIAHRSIKGFCAAFFRSPEQIGRVLKEVMELKPSAVEFLDAATMSFIDGEHLRADDPDIAGALLMEFDESERQASGGKKIVKNHDPVRMIDVSPDKADEVWDERKKILPSLWAYARKKGWSLPSIIDDIAIHRDDFPSVFTDLRKLMKDLGHEIAIYGHIGFGSLHARPFFQPDRGNIEDQIHRVSTRTFEVLQKYGGTLVGEHNCGRSRSIYLEMELGSAFHYLKEIKELFDPRNILNPHAIFDLGPITQDMVLSK